MLCRSGQHQLTWLPSRQDEDENYEEDEREDGEEFVLHLRRACDSPKEEVMRVELIARNPWYTKPLIFLSRSMADLLPLARIAKEHEEVEISMGDCRAFALYLRSRTILALLSSPASALISSL